MTDERFSTQGQRPQLLIKSPRESPTLGEEEFTQETSLKQGQKANSFNNQVAASSTIDTIINKTPSTMALSQPSTVQDCPQYLQAASKAPLSVQSAVQFASLIPSGEEQKLNPQYKAYSFFHTRSRERLTSIPQSAGKVGMIQGSYIPESSNSSINEYSREQEEATLNAEEQEDALVLENKGSEMNSDQEGESINHLQETNFKKPRQLPQDDDVAQNQTERVNKASKGTSQQKKPIKKQASKTLKKEQKSMSGTGQGGYTRPTAPASSDENDDENLQSSQKLHEQAQRGMLLLLRAIDFIEFEERFKQRRNSDSLYVDSQSDEAEQSQRQASNSSMESQNQRGHNTVIIEQPNYEALLQIPIPAGVGAGQTFIDIKSKKQFRRCGNDICSFFCLANDPQWVKRKKANGFFYLCQICADAYNKGQYCDFCKQVYYDGNSDITDGKNWLMCDHCNKWNHIDCESEINKNHEIYELADKDDFKYFCLACTKARKPKTNPCPSIQRKSTPPFNEAVGQTSSEEEKEAPHQHPDEKDVTPFNILNNENEDEGSSHQVQTSTVQEGMMTRTRRAGARLSTKKL